MRFGFGYDIHPLIEGRSLVLGGVLIPFEKGLEGHSDADVLCHAISDALLGAASLGDIGEHFPDTDTAFKDASSLVLLSKVGDLVGKAGHFIVNIDSTIVIEAPKLFPFRKEMIKKISKALNIDGKIVSIKATTNEGFGVIGQGEAAAAFAVASLEKNG